MATRTSSRLAALVCVAGLAGAACGGGGDSSASTTEPMATDAAEVQDAGDATTESGAVVPASLQFTAPLIGGGEIVGDELAGKPTAFWFWSPT